MTSLAPDSRPADRPMTLEPQSQPQPQPQLHADADDGPRAHRGRADLVARLRARYPDVPTALIDRSIDDATFRYREARVRSFLPVLLERAACEALERAAGSGDFLCE